MNRPHAAIRTILLTAFAACGGHGQASANPAEARRMLENGAFDRARDHYRQLADESHSSDRRAALRLGQGLAAYRAGDFRGARTGYSEALLSSDHAVRHRAHHGLGNSLFQLGWIGLADAPYPADPQQTPDLDTLDRIARERIAQMLDAPEPENGETDGYVRIRNTILNWSDAARHYQSAMEIDPSHAGVLANHRTTLAFLERLEEILREEHDETQQSLPMPSPGEGPPQQPESGPGEEPQDGEPENPGENEPPEQPNGDSSDNPGSESGQGEPSGEPQDDEPDGESQPQDGESPPGEAENQEPDPGDPNESPEERARRILSENADVETGPFNPGRREFLPPAKDW